MHRISNQAFRSNLIIDCPHPHRPLESRIMSYLIGLESICRVFCFTKIEKLINK